MDELVNLDDFINGLTSVDASNLRRLVAEIRPVILATTFVEGEDAGLYVATLFTKPHRGRGRRVRTPSLQTPDRRRDDVAGTAHEGRTDDPYAPRVLSAYRWRSAVRSRTSNTRSSAFQ